MRYFTVETLGRHRSLTREGFLLCQDIPIGRLGVQIYDPSEITDDEGRPLIEGFEGVVRVDRIAEEVFAPAAIASAEGKPITDDHPQEGDERVDVTPDNWRNFSCGVMLNVRRGFGIEDDLLLADLMIQHRDAIEAVTGGKVELSIGYDSDYYQTAPGRAEQRNIRINHVALVESGRCGPRCAIGDSASTGVSRMTKFSDWMIGQARRIRGARTEDEAQAIAKEAPPKEAAAEAAGGAGETHLHVHTGGSRAEPAARRDERDPDEGRREEPRREERGDPDRRERREGRGDPRDRLRDRLRSRGGRRDEEGGEDPYTRAEGDPAGERFEALEDQHQEMAADLQDALEMVADLQDTVEGLAAELGMDENDMRSMSDARRRGRQDSGRRDARMRPARRDDRGSRFESRRSDSRRRDERDPPAREREKDREDDDRRSRDAEPAEGNRSILGNLEEEAPAGSAEKARKARDSEYLGQSFQEAVAVAELLAPGISLPTYDKAARPAKTFDDICGLRRRALSTAYGTADGKQRIEEVIGTGRAFDAKTLDCSRVRATFLAVGALTKLANNAAGQARDGSGQQQAATGIRSPIDLNKVNEKFWADHKATV